MPGIASSFGWLSALTQLAVVPAASEFTKFGEHGFRYLIGETPVQTKSDRSPTGASQRNVVPGQIDPLEAVALFELNQCVSLFVPIAKSRINQVRDSAGSTRADCFGNQCVRWGLVPVLDQRNDVHQSRLGSSFIAYQLDETNEFFTEERPNKEAAVQECPSLLPHPLDVFSVVGKRLSSADRALVVDLPDSLNQGVIER